MEELVRIALALLWENARILHNELLDGKLHFKKSLYIS